MRDKRKFLDAADEVLKDEFKEELNVVEDAAHLMNQNVSTKYTIPKQFTTTGKDEIFLFEKKERPRTDKPEESIEDYFYVGRGE